MSDRIVRVGSHIAPAAAAATAATTRAPMDLTTCAIPVSELKGNPAEGGVKSFDDLPGPWKKAAKNFTRTNIEDMAAHGLSAQVTLQLLDWKHEYGNMYRFLSVDADLKLVTSVVLSDPRVVNSFHSRLVHKTPNYQQFLLLGEGVLSTTNHDEWKVQRDLLKPYFTVEQLKSVLPGMHVAIEKSLDMMSKAAAAQVVIDLMEELPKMTFEIIGHAALGEDPDFVNAMTNDVRHAFDTVSIKPFERAKIADDEEYRKAYATMLQFNDTVMKRADQKASAAAAAAGCPFHAAKITKANASANSGPHANVLDYIRKVDQQGKPILDPKMQSDELFTFMFAGHETTANTLGFLCAELSRRPQLQHELRASIVDAPEFRKAKEQAIAAGKGAGDAYKFLSYTDLLRFELLTKFLNETMRRWPVVASGTFRVIEEDYVIAGYFIPKGTMIRTPHYNVHLSEEVWDDPLEFNPHRKWHNEAFLPFSRGPRDCLGRLLALMEMRLVVVAFFSNFHMEAVNTTKPLRFFERLTIRPRGPVNVKLSIMHL